MNATTRSSPLLAIRTILYPCYTKVFVSVVLITTLAAVALAAPPQIPALPWEERSDWINVKTDMAPAAIGDGKADDTAAIQNALTRVRDGSVLYFPPGSYRITAPLVLKNATGSQVGRWADRRVRARHEMGLGWRRRRDDADSEWHGVLTVCRP